MRRLGTVAAASALAATALTITAAPAQAETHTFHPNTANCWGSYTISPDGWGLIQASASTFCSTPAFQMTVTVQVRQRDPFGFVSNCGGSANAGDFNVNNVIATADTCPDMGAGYTYWAYSTNWADIDGQIISFDSGNYNG